MVQSSRFSWTSPVVILSHKEMGLHKSLLGFKLRVDLGIGVSPAFTESAKVERQKQSSLIQRQVLCFKCFCPQTIFKLDKILL